MSNRTLLATCALLCALSASSLAESFSSPRGYSLEYPDGWVVLNKALQANLINKYRSQVPQVANINFDMIDVFIFNPSRVDFVENINVVVTKGRLSIDEGVRKTVVKKSAGQLKRIGCVVLNHRSSIETFGRNRGISQQWETVFPQQALKVKQWQAIIPSGSETIGVTCTAPADVYAEYEPLFASTINSVTLEGGLLGLWHGLHPILRGVMIGGLIGLVIAVTRKLTTAR